MRKSRRTPFPEQAICLRSFSLRSLRELALAAALAVLTAASCGGPDAAAPPPETAAPPSERGPRVLFEFVTIDGKPLSTDTLAGRISVIGFTTTYDTASQAQVRVFADLLRHHKPRINVAVLVLEPPENEPMINAFAQALSLPYPVANADAATIAGRGPFAGLHHVPSVVILDRQGREAFRHLGLIAEEPLSLAIREIETADASTRASARASLTMGPRAAPNPSALARANGASPP
jgi:hypothetical protein